MTYLGLRSGRHNRLNSAYVIILWLFIGRFGWTVWKYFRARRQVSAFRSGVERQLKLSGVPTESLPKTFEREKPHG